MKKLAFPKAPVLRPAGAQLAEQPRRREAGRQRASGVEAVDHAAWRPKDGFLVG